MLAHCPHLMKAGPDASRIRRKSPYQSSFPHVHPSRSKIGAKSASGEKTTHNCAARAHVFAACAHDLRSLAASTTASSFAASASATTPSFARIRSKHRAQPVEHAAPPSAAAAAAAQRLRPRRPRVAAAARSVPRRASRIARVATVVVSTLLAVRVAVARVVAALAARVVAAIVAREVDAVAAHRADADATRSSVVVASRHRRIVVVDRTRGVTRRRRRRRRITTLTKPQSVGFAFRRFRVQSFVFPSVRSAVPPFVFFAVVRRRVVARVERANDASSVVVRDAASRGARRC